MKKTGLLLIFSLLSITQSFGWGFYAHKQINRLAVFTLPPPLIGLYKMNIKYITEHAVDADKRRYISADEACRHYLDADHYEKSMPFDTLPKYWRLAIEKYTQDTLEEYGIVPWHVNYTFKKFMWAFADTSKTPAEKTKRILKLSADLGHYVGDLHVPLHSTSNYNGQQTDQIGIHALWESRMPPLYDSSYDFFVGKAQIYEAPIDSVWQAITRSHILVDSVLLLEKQASKIIGDANKYTFVSTGYGTKRDYSVPFCNTYNNLMGNMIEERMTKSILFLGSLWYTAWFEADQPNMQGVPIFYPEEDLTPIMHGGKMIGRKEE